MNVRSDSFTFAMIPLSLGITGLLFLAAAFWLRAKYAYRGGLKATGTLLGFRKLDNDHYFGAMRTAMGRGRFEDYLYNYPNSRPVLRFSDNGKVVEYHADWAVPDLGKDDIGRTLPIRYFVSRRGRYRVILEGKQYEGQRSRGRKLFFWIFAGTALPFLATAVFAWISLF